MAANRGRTNTFMIEEIADEPVSSNPPHPLHVHVVHGDLLSQANLDVIVSFLTEDLSWGGPINQQLIGTVGHQLDEFVLQHVSSPKPGDAFSTPAYGLPFKHLIFGVIPKWDGGLSGEDRYFKRAIINALHLAKNTKELRIGIPAVGLGRDDLPLRRGARIIFKAIEENADESFREIRLICKTSQAYEAYQDRLETA